ncbi:MAG: hypothetical protein ABIF92_01730, partial [archaeon]
KEGKKENKEEFHGQYYEKNKIAAYDFLNRISERLRARFQEVIPFLIFDVEVDEQTEVTEYFKFTRYEEIDSKKDANVEIDEPTKNFLKKVYLDHTRGGTRKDSKRKGLATRVGAVFWGLVGLESWHWEEVGLQYLWTNALRSLFNFIDRKDRPEVFFGWALHEFLHTFGINHHKGRRCVMNNQNDRFVCKDCLTHIRRYIEELK